MISTTRTTASPIVDALLGMSLRVDNADVMLKCEPLENGAAAQLRFSDLGRFTWRIEDGNLEVAEVNSKKRIHLFGVELPFSIGGEATLSITIADALPGAFRFVGGGGDLQAQDLRTAGAISLQSAGGEIKLRDCRSESDLVL